MYDFSIFDIFKNFLTYAGKGSTPTITNEWKNASLEIWEDENGSPWTTN